MIICVVVLPKDVQTVRIITQLEKREELDGWTIEMMDTR